MLLHKTRTPSFSLNLRVLSLADSLSLDLSLILFMLPLYFCPLLHSFYITSTMVLKLHILIWSLWTENSKSKFFSCGYSYYITFCYHITNLSVIILLRPMGPIKILKAVFFYVDPHPIYYYIPSCIHFVNIPSKLHILIHLKF